MTFILSLPYAALTTAPSPHKPQPILSLDTQLSNIRVPVLSAPSLRESHAVPIMIAARQSAHKTDDAGMMNAWSNAFGLAVGAEVQRGVGGHVAPAVGGAERLAQRLGDPVAGAFG